MTTRPSAPSGGPVRLTARCKINLGLKITGRLENGYHTLRSVFLPLPEPCDTLLVRVEGGGGVRVRTATPGIDPERNTITKACDVFAAATGFAPSLVIDLEKGIPWGAGLGGGSSDAAQTLRCLRSLPGAPAVTDRELAAMAARVGADVCFFLQDGPMLVTGIGDVLAPCEPVLPGRFLLLTIPDERVSTPWAYRAYDALPEAARRAAPGPGAGPFANDLELPVLPAYPEIARVKREIGELGAVVAAMSGSGCGVYGFFREREIAERAKRQLRNVRESYLIAL